MNTEQLATDLASGDSAAAAELLRSYLVPHVTKLKEDRIGHDLAPDTLEFGRGVFMPAGERIIIEVDAAYAFLGNARAALLMVVGQPEQPGVTLYDSGGAPVPGTRWFSMGSVNGESGWASTTHRRIVIDVDPSTPVTWQLVGAITGGAYMVPVPDANRIAITPDGSKAFVTSPPRGTVTPIALGRPGYTMDSTLTVQDIGLDPILVGEHPERLAADDDHVVVCLHDSVVILAAPDGQILHRVGLRDGSATDCALTPDGNEAVVTGATGRVTRIVLASGEVVDAEVGGRLQGIAVASDGGAVFVADTEGSVVHHLSLPDLEIRATIPVADAPHIVRVAPDGRFWILCDPPSDVGRLQGVDPERNEVVADHALPFPRPSDLKIVPVDGQSSPVVRTAWVVFDGGRYCQQLIGGRFDGQPHSFHHGALPNDEDGPPASIALNDYGEIWVTQPGLDQVWKWPGGRLLCRADESRPSSGVFFGEYCDVAIYGARDASTTAPA